ncbi:MAG TPA: hypothetical protein VIL10_05800 [Marmoricola sp.]
MKHTIRRSYLVRRVDTYTLESAMVTDAQHAIDEHRDEFDNEVMMFGELVDEQIELVEYDELKLEVIDRESAKVIPFKPREGQKS